MICGLKGKGTRVCQIGTAAAILIFFVIENVNAFSSLVSSPPKHVIHHRIQSESSLIRPRNINLTRISNCPSYSALLAVEYEQDIDSDSDEGNYDSTYLSDENVGKAILSLAVPALASLAIDPLMTLADTAFIGRTADDSSALAGMGSAAALLTFSFYIFNFLCTVTTPLVSKKRAAKDNVGAIEVGSQALSLAIVLGFTLSTVLIAFSQPLLLLMGTFNTGLEANAFATSFLTIRALAAPAVFVSSASTGILRGYLDTKTALFLIATANVINFTLDVILIGVLHMGPTGAAIATTTAEWLCALYFLFVLAGKVPSADGRLGSNQTWKEGIHPDASSYTHLDSPDFLVITPTLVLPPWSNIKPLIVAASSVFIRSFMLQLSIAGAAAAAARTQTIESSASASIAAHQIGLQIWLLCSFICDALAAASQTLVADGLGKNDQNSVRTISRKIFTYSLFLGFFLAGCLELGDRTGILLNFFTTDETTQSALKPLLGVLILAQPLNSFVFAADGVIQGASEFEFQAKSMILSASVAMLSFFVFHFFGDPSNSLSYIWYSLVILQMMRGITSLNKLVDDDGPIDLLGRKLLL